MAGLGKDALQGHWVHSHEEDSGSEMVFRPASHPLPPSRGRTAFELRPDGTYVERSPGPVDVPEESSGEWALEDDHLALIAKGDRPNRTWKIDSAANDRLVLRRV